MAIIKKGGAKPAPAKAPEKVEPKEEKKTATPATPAKAPAKAPAKDKEVKKPIVAEANKDTVEETTPADTNPENFTFKVKVDNKRYEGRTAEQAVQITAGTIGCVKKLTIERQ